MALSFRGVNKKRQQGAGISPNVIKLRPKKAFPRVLKEMAEGLFSVLAGRNEKMFFDTFRGLVVRGLETVAIVCFRKIVPFPRKMRY